MRTERLRSELWKSGAVLGLAVLAGASGCKSNQTANTPAPIVDANGGPDPASVNNAPVSATTTTGTNGYGPIAPLRSSQPARVLGQQAYGPPPSSSGEQYPEQTGPAYPAGQGQPYPAGNDGSVGGYDAAYDQQVNAGQDALYASQPPPPLPVYEQPELTDPGDQWTPGYWSYAPQGYYWVPGAWVAPPFIGALWTPGYWGFYGGRYRFNHGFWGQHIGFYGGVPYGFGYTGYGYEGGYWNGNRFFYNNAVNRVNGNVVHNVYVRNVTVVNNTRVSYNGPGGWNARPTASDLAVLHEQRVPAMQVQRQRAQEAASNRQQFAENHGRPAMAVLATRQPADRVAPAALAPIGRAEAGNAQRPVQAGGFAPGNGAGRMPQEGGRGQAGFPTRSNEPQPGSVGRPGMQEQMRPGSQPQQVRPQMEGQPRAVPEAQRPTPNQPRTPSPDQQRQVPNQQLPDQQRQNQQRSQPSQAQPVRPQPEARPEVQPEPAIRPTPQVQMQPRPQPEAQPRPQPQVQAQPRPQTQVQAPPRPQAQPQDRPQPQAQPRSEPQARPQPAPHPEESHPHL